MRPSRQARSGAGLAPRPGAAGSAFLAQLQARLPHPVGAAAGDRAPGLAQLPPAAEFERVHVFAAPLAGRDLEGADRLDPAAAAAVRVVPLGRGAADVRLERQRNRRLDHPLVGRADRLEAGDFPLDAPFGEIVGARQADHGGDDRGGDGRESGSGGSGSGGSGEGSGGEGGESGSSGSSGSGEGGESGDDGAEGGESGDDGAEGGEAGEAGEAGAEAAEGGEAGEAGEAGAAGSSGPSSASPAAFGGLDQVGPDLSQDQEADAISKGWQ